MLRLSKFKLIKPPTYALHPVMMNNTSPPRITATAGTKLVGASFTTFCHFLTLSKEFYGKRPSSLTRYHWIELSFIVQYSTLLPHKEAGPFLIPSVADRPLSSAKDLWLNIIKNKDT